MIGEVDKAAEIQITGIEAEHAGAPRFLRRGAIPYNTIWRVEIDGVKLLHLGNNSLNYTLRK